MPNAVTIEQSGHAAGRSNTWSKCYSLLTECERSRERKTIWKLAKSLWRGTGRRWPKLDMGAILASGAHHLPREENERDGSIEQAMKTSLLRIIVSESAHLIWAIRCERVIRDRYHSTQEICRRWHNKIYNHLFMDRTLATKVQRTAQSTSGWWTEARSTLIGPKTLGV
jgi:hypothetical protein